jgi:hypothetical protein
MIGVGAEAIEARSMTSDLTDWHQALARVNSSEENERTLESENNLCAASSARILEKEVCRMSESVTSAVHLIQTLGIKLRDILCLLPVSKAAAPNK